jgi:hypothetical protein
LRSRERHANRGLKSWVQTALTGLTKARGEVHCQFREPINRRPAVVVSRFERSVVRTVVDDCKGCKLPPRAVPGTSTEYVLLLHRVALILALRLYFGQGTDIEHEIPNVIVRLDLRKRWHPAQANAVPDNPEKFPIRIGRAAFRAEESLAFLGAGATSFQSLPAFCPLFCRTGSHIKNEYQTKE